MNNIPWVAWRAQTTLRRCSLDVMFDEQYALHEVGAKTPTKSATGSYIATGLPMGNCGTWAITDLYNSPKADTIF